MVDPNSSMATKEGANHATDDVACLRHQECIKARIIGTNEKPLCSERPSSTCKEKRESIE